MLLSRCTHVCASPAGVLGTRHLCSRIIATRNIVGRFSGVAAAAAAAIAATALSAECEAAPQTLQGAADAYGGVTITDTRTLLLR